MEVDNRKNIYILLIIGLLILFSSNVFSQQLTFDSLNTFSSGYDDFLYNQPIKIWFNNDLDFQSLSSNTTFESDKGDSLIMRYAEGDKYFSIASYPENFIPLDKITVTLGNGITDRAGNPLGTTHTLEILVGPVVYPGDTDNNGVVDERDILPLGIFWQDTGPMRPDSTSLIWELKPAHRWNVIRATYADADGNGIVEAHDICGISDNFSSTLTASASEMNNIIYPLLKQTGNGFATQIYAALVDCSNKGVGKQALLDILEPIVNKPEIILPNNFTLYQNYPNPFNPSTTIEFYLPEESQVTLSIYNITGQLVTTLIDGIRPGGFSEVEWNGQDLYSNSVASGIYFYRLQTVDKTYSKRMLLLK